MIYSDTKERGSSAIVATVKELSANDSTGRVVVTDDYTFRDTRRTLHSQIVSSFEFRDGKIIKQTDECDSVSFARQSFGGIKGFVAGHVSLIRRCSAMKKLKEERPEAFHAR